MKWKVAKVYVGKAPPAFQSLGFQNGTLACAIPKANASILKLAYLRKT